MTPPLPHSRHFVPLLKWIPRTFPEHSQNILRTFPNTINVKCLAPPIHFKKVEQNDVKEGSAFGSTFSKGGYK
jgi:hypothetical protein